MTKTETFYERFFDLIRQQGNDVQDVYLLSNVNSELLSSQHQNLLDSRNFSLEFINEINQKLTQIPGERLVYDELEISSSIFLERLHALIFLFEKQGRNKETKFLSGVAQTINYLNINDLVVTKKPNLFSHEEEDLEEILHPNLLKMPLVRRTLSGFVMFREIPRLDILGAFQ